ncbi:MAG: glycosyl hydrolase family 28 protein [Terracidiphilus sp.]
MTYVRASQIGCALDCDLSSGRNKYHGGAATDDGPRINAAMAGATASNPITLIIDGGALISGLFLPAGGYWSIAGLGCGTGFFIKSGTNNDGIHNGGPRAAVPSDPGPPPPSRGVNVSLSNFTLNGNRGNGQDGDSTTGSPQGVTNANGIANVWYFGINLMNLNNITIQNLVVVNSPSYHIRLSNVGNVTVSGCLLRSFGPSTDGIHFDGPANDISISNCNITSGDDGIALNCPEGYSGNISRVSVSNCTFSSWSLMRLDTIEQFADPHKFNIDTVTVSNCSGTLVEAGFLIGDAATSNPNSVTALTISDCNLTAPAVLELGASFGSISLNNVIFVPSHLNEPQQFAAPGFAFARTSAFFYDATYAGSILTFNNCVIELNDSVPVAALVLEYNSTIASLVFNGFSLQNTVSNSSMPELLDPVSGSIGTLILNSLNSSGISAPVFQGGFADIGTVSGSGVLGTGWQFPDSVMANGVPYISATTGLPSIKVDGVVEPYSPT